MGKKRTSREWGERIQFILKETFRKRNREKKKNEERNETIEPWEEEKALDDNLGKHLNGYRC